MKQSTKMTRVDAIQPLMGLRDLRTRLVDHIDPNVAVSIIDILTRTHPDLGPSVLSLSARAPYADNGLLDFYAPGRWDSTSDLVFMQSIHQVGASVGEWEGTVGYATYSVPDPGTYLVALAFSGIAQTMQMDGPFGRVTMPSNSVHEVQLLTATVTASTSGQQFWTNFSSRQDQGWSGLAYLHTFSVHRLG